VIVIILFGLTESVRLPVQQI